MTTIFITQVRSSKLLLLILFVPDTAITDIEDCLKKFIKRDDIDIILINQNVSTLIFRSSSK